MTIQQLEDYLRAMFSQEKRPVFLRFIYSDGLVVDWTFPPRLSGQDATSKATKPLPAAVLPSEAPATEEEPLDEAEIAARLAQATGNGRA